VADEADPTWRRGRPDVADEADPTWPTRPTRRGVEADPTWRRGRPDVADEADPTRPAILTDGVNGARGNGDDAVPLRVR
jgi:hypothetical protein